MFLVMKQAFCKSKVVPYLDQGMAATSPEIAKVFKGYNWRPMPINVSEVRKIHIYRNYL